MSVGTKAFPVNVIIFDCIVFFICSGRRITARGQKDLDQIAGQVSHVFGLSAVNYCVYMYILADDD